MASVRQPVAEFLFSGPLKQSLLLITISILLLRLLHNAHMFVSLNKFYTARVALVSGVVYCDS